MNYRVLLVAAVAALFGFSAQAVEWSGAQVVTANVDDDIELLDQVEVTVASGSTFAINGKISGSGSIKLVGGGTLQLAVSNDFSGGAIHVSQPGDAYFLKVDNNTVVMLDAPENVLSAVISKQAAGGGKELVGAKLTVKLVVPDNKGDDLSKVKGTTDVTYNKDDNSVTWTSGTAANTLSELPAGVYTLTEVTAPDGYEVAETICFKVASDGKIYSIPEKDYKNDGSTDWGKPVTNSTVIMFDAPKPGNQSDGTTYKFSFTKKDNFGKALSGAQFKLKGTDYDKTATSDANGLVSFEGLKPGVYTLGNGRFRIERPKTLFAMKSRYRRKGGHERVKVPVGRRADWLSLLHTSAFTGRRPQMTLVVAYADGTEEKIEFEGGKNVRDAFSPAPDDLFNEEEGTITCLALTVKQSFFSMNS